MILSTAERQRQYKNKMYRAGYKGKFLWVKRISKFKNKEINMALFLKELKKINEKLDKAKSSALLILLLEIAEAKKEVSRKK